MSPDILMRQEEEQKATKAETECMELRKRLTRRPLPTRKDQRERSAAKKQLAKHGIRWMR